MKNDSLEENTFIKSQSSCGFNLKKLNENLTSQVDSSYDKTNYNQYLNSQNIIKDKEDYDLNIKETNNYLHRNDLEKESDEYYSMSNKNNTKLDNKRNNKVDLEKNHTNLLINSSSTNKDNSGFYKINNKDVKDFNKNQDKNSVNLNKTKELEEKVSMLEKDVEFWRNLYINQVKESFSFEQTIKNLYEENRLNQEYIISLETRISKILDKSNNITNNYYNNIKALHKLVSSLEEKLNENMTSNTNNNNITNNYNLGNLNYQIELAEDFKSQLQILSEDKENLTSNLALSRHQCLQSSIKLEEQQNKILRMHQQNILLKQISVIENES